MIVAIIQARMGSTRLPEKIFKKIIEKEVLLYQIERVRRSNFLDEIIIATTELAEDDVVEEFCVLNKIKCFRGNNENVLNRYYKCAESFELKENDVIVRLTGDCPLMDYTLMDKIIEVFVSDNVDYYSNINPPTYPDGLDVEVFSFKTLKKVVKNATLKSEKEHVTPYIKKNSHIFKSKNYESKVNYADYRWTLDEEKDYIFIKKIYEHFKDRDYFGYNEIIDFLKNNEELSIINSSFERNAGYKKSLENDR